MRRIAALVAIGISLTLAPGDALAKKKAKRQRPSESNVAGDAETTQGTGTNAKTRVPRLVPPKQSPQAPRDEDGAAPGEVSGEPDDEPGVALGEEDIVGGRGAGVFRSLLQLRYSATRPDAGANTPQRGTVQANDGYDIQRAFLRYVATPAKTVEGKLLIDFAELKHGNAKQSLKLAFASYRPTRRVRFDVGLLKRPFSLLELLPISKHELSDVGEVDNFIKDQGYGGRDFGVIARFQPLSRRRMLTVSIGAYRGDIDEGFDASPVKLVGGRLETHPIKHLRLGVDAVWRPFSNVRMTEPADASVAAYTKAAVMKHGMAASTDATLTFRHFEARAEMLLGKRTDLVAIASSNGRQSSFWAAWIVLAPQFEVGNVLLVPAARAEILDVDPLNPAGGRKRTLSAVLGLVPFTGVRLLTDVTRSWNDRDFIALDKVPWSHGQAKYYVTEPNWTRVTIQTQLIF
ncbi:MAG TPA: hypothetical protein VIV60_11370 [Polyangiaceae bacterium]